MTYSDEQIAAIVADAERDGTIEYTSEGPLSWIEARTTARGTTTWTVHVADEDLLAAVDRAKEALAKATERPKRAPAVPGSALLEVDR